MKGDWKEKLDYKKFTNKQLEEELKDLKYQLILAKSGFGKSKVKNITEKGMHGSDIQKRIRKGIARILTELTRRKNERGNL